MPAPEPDEEEGVLHLGGVNGVTLVSLPSADYGSAREEWGSRSGNDLGNVPARRPRQTDLNTPTADAPSKAHHSAPPPVPSRH